MASPIVAYRERSLLPRFGSAAPSNPFLLDTNVFINALAGRGPAELKTFLSNLPQSFVSGPTLAELSWPKGRLDPSHPDTAKVLRLYDEVIAQLDALRILSPSPSQWARAGELAGEAARAVAGRAKSIKTAFDRIEFINDAATAVVALDVGATVITQDGDFDLFLQLAPGLTVLFYD